MNKIQWTTAIAIQQYYLYKIFLLADYAVMYFYDQTQLGNYWHWPAAWLEYYQSSKHIVFLVVSLGIIFSILSIKYPFRRGVKIFAEVFFFIFFAIYYSHVKIYHSIHCFIYAGFFIALIKDDKNIKLLMKSTIALFAFPYFLSGMWKLRYLLTLSNVKDIALVMPYQLAYNSIEAAYYPKGIVQILNLNSSWHYVFWISIVIFELLGIVVLLKTKFFKYWGVLLIIFHTTTDILMQIEFFQAMVLSLILLFWSFENLSEQDIAFKKIVF